MRSVIVDFARRRQAARRGGGSADVRLATDFGEMSHGASEILRVHDALDEMAALDQRLASIVEMRYFGGMTESEIASAIGLNERTVRRDWEKARLFLRDALGSSSPRTGQS
jgi:RNA polymerase sigma factor (TIGR02999 family)